MSSPDFSGVGVALMTVFDDSGRLDASASASLAERLVELEVAAVIVAGSTGEAKTLSPEERDQLLRAVRGVIPQGSAMPVLAGTSAASTEEAVYLTKRARECGADGFLVLSPPGSDDLVEYYGQVAHIAAGLPVLAYHYPVASSPGIRVDQLADLAIDGLKDTSGDPERLLMTRFEWDGLLYTGSSALLTMAGSIGCTGAILTLANAMPEIFIAAFDGDGEVQVRLIENHLAVNRDFPAEIKLLTSERFGTSRFARLRQGRRRGRRPWIAIGCGPRFHWGEIARDGVRMQSSHDRRIAPEWVHRLEW